ncbi:MAG: hypothetical protein AB8H03_23180 [Saprospiraceae bacterium]
MKIFNFLSLLILLLTVLSFTSCKDDSLKLKPEVTSDWFYQVGQSFEYSQATNAYNLNEPSKGEGMTWDFYDAQGNPQDDLLIVSPTGLPGSDLFPDANIAMKDDGSDQINFYKKDNDTLLQLGVYLNSTFHYKYSDPLILSITPLSFEASFEDSYTSTLYTNNSQSSTSTIHVTTEYGGQGTVKTPYGTFNDCVMYEVVKTNSAGEVTDREYHFYKGNLINRIASYTLKLNTNNSGYISQFYWGEEK